ncbi:hypothetical protein DY000_02041783 [Brassica cretica]|uniref:Uncharacterized protein n=1 Tax=Brassica cretica TaxID=69181 RepID=A0ABQ7BP98_BRACR|nr:hypothetical protein DY000_02041783 [Brassica cretica]
MEHLYAGCSQNIYPCAGEVEIRKCLPPEVKRGPDRQKKSRWQSWLELSRFRGHKRGSYTRITAAQTANNLVIHVQTATNLFRKSSVRLPRVFHKSSKGRLHVFWKSSSLQVFSTSFVSRLRVV